MSNIQNCFKNQVQIKYFDSNKVSDVDLIHILSNNIQVYPCGKRRSIVSNKYTDKAEANFSIIFDPEARLNTEANNLRHSSLNGYKQNYIQSYREFEIETEGSKKEEKAEFILVIAGYLFRITDVRLSDLGELLGVDARRLYANIVLEESPIFETDDQQYNTFSLRNQPCVEPDDQALNALDLFMGNITGTLDETSDPNKYYFSGLSFSAVPLTADEVDTGKIVNTYELIVPGGRTKQIISLYVADCQESEGTAGDKIYTWLLREEAKLPRIEHGSTADSVKLVNVEATDVKTESVNSNHGSFSTEVKSAKFIQKFDQKEISVPSIQLDSLATNTYRLNFYFKTS